MRISMRCFIAAVAAATLSVGAFAADLMPGSKAPEVKVQNWIKGTPVNKFEKGKVYVVEFWATWCGPCRESIPHLTELAKENPSVKFVGVSIWEDNKDDAVAKFVKDMGDKMNYNVAYGGNKEGMAETWMQAAYRNGIPSAFLIKGDEICWIGHPMELDEPLKKVLAGNFDVSAEKTKYGKYIQGRKAEKEVAAKIKEAQECYAKGDKKKANDLLDQAASMSDESKSEIDMIRFGWLAKEDPAAWENKAAEYSKTDEGRSTLCSFAMQQTQNGDVKAGAKAIELAVRNCKDSDVVCFYYGTEFYSQTKDYKRALELVNKAIAGIPNSQFKDNDEVKQMFDRMKTDLEAKAKG
ncbi:MAG: TlpA family protein disulfide reductase [Armatimonadetes bacterium]|nr:TlpA family protein disulfide reductase [Armatimonadota bacterium]